MILRRLLQREQPSDMPADVLDRLMRYERERQERMSLYRAAWARKWADQGASAERRPGLWRIK